MQVEVYRRAINRINSLQEELRRLKTFISTYEMLATGDGSSDASPQFLARGVQRTNRRSAATKAGDLERIVLEIIETNGAPLQRVELFELAMARGVAIAGTKQLGNFSSKLSRLDSLINLPKLGYWLKGHPFEPAGYNPGQQTGQN
jgi:hypothetical protein